MRTKIFAALVGLLVACGTPPTSQGEFGALQQQVTPVGCGWTEAELDRVLGVPGSCAGCVPGSVTYPDPTNPTYAIWTYTARLLVFHVLDGCVIDVEPIRFCERYEASR